MKTTLNLHDELLNAAKQRALDRGRTLTSVIEDALRAYLFGGTAREEAPKYEFNFPVVHDTAPPSIDVLNRDAIYEEWLADESRLYVKRKRK
ncbi:MAG: hypothetical protein ACYDCC_02680 [Actinomycetota bacterium]